MSQETKKISEDFSEKKKRGRPRFWTPEYEKMIRLENQYCDIRTLQNQDYESRALVVLGISSTNPPDFPFLWLTDSSKIELGKSDRRGYKKSILAELGRIKDKSNLIEAATEICRLKPKTVEAIKLIRSWRLRKPLPPANLRLILQKAIEDFRINHPDITNKNIYEILCNLEDEYF